ncbi:hypothetical protein BH10PSE7_BH10PSE7_37520 [soil metagenome]
MKTCLLAASAAAFLALNSGAEARTRILLVGVADYNEPSGIHDLLGPRNDVTAMWRLFKSRGVDPADMTVLSDGLPVSPDFPAIKGPPTFANITGALDTLAEISDPKDDVVLFYSGHGTQQPDNDPANEIEPEPDGLDQVLLPSDTGPYDPMGGGIKNSLVDDLLGKKLDAVRAKGTFVWAIIDSCSSGTVTRGEDVTRSVDPQSLGVPEFKVDPAKIVRAGKREGTLKVTESNDLVGFYAVDAFDQAIERPFPGYSIPMVGEGKTQRMGVFTYILHNALTRGTARTYADLAREVSADLATDRSGGRVPQPVFDGQLDRPILGTNPSGPRLMSGMMSGGDTLEIPDAGSLHGFEEGARLAIYAPAKPDEPIGRAQIRSAEFSRSVAGGISWEPGVTKILNGPVAVKLTEPAITFRFVVAPPPQADLSGADAKTIGPALEEAFGPASGSKDIGIALGAPGDPDGDVLLRVGEGRLWIVRPDRPLNETKGGFGETPSIAIGIDPKDLGEKAKQAIWLLARAAKLVRLGASMSEGGAMEGLTIKAERQKRPAPSDPAQACAKPAKSDPWEAFDAFTAQGVGNCDVVRLKIANETDTTYYVGGFYVDAMGGVQTLSNQDRTRGCVRTLYSGSGGEVTYTLQINTWDAEHKRPAAIGVENAVILAIPQDATKIAPRLCSLVQPTLAETQATRGVEDARGSGGALKTLLSGITGSSTRSASIAPEADEGAAKVSGSLFVFDVRP